MEDTIPRILFDRRDYELLNIVNEMLTRSKAPSYTRRMYYPYFHPRGIKEMVETKGLRTAYAIAHLLESIELGKVEDRLNALRSLRDEVLNTAEGPLPKNTARVLLQIMKELVRARGNLRRQLMLAHDFRMSASGRPRLIRRQLKRYHLLEMSEEWNQVAFDDHVHDANTKGRKSATHLIMDAWIKGIRRLRVIYYNHIQPKFAAELLEAAGILGITVRIGIEFWCHFRDRYAQIIWVPRGFPDTPSFLCFLEEPPVRALMAEGQAVSEYQKAHVLATLQEFNRKHRLEINRAYQIELTELDAHQFLTFVRPGQASLLHLAKFIHQKMLQAMRTRMESLRARHAGSQDADERRRIEALVQKMNTLEAEQLLEAYLKPAQNPSLTDPDRPQTEGEVPPLLRLDARALTERLAKLHSAYRFTLNLSNLSAADVLELLYDCEGAISRLEIFNLKDHAEGKTDHIPQICRLQQALNSGNPMVLKRAVRSIIANDQAARKPRPPAQTAKLNTILHDIVSLQADYTGKPLIARIGSDSTGRSPRIHGMGLVVEDTLPPRVQSELRHLQSTGRTRIPLNIPAYPRTTALPAAGNTPVPKTLLLLLRRLPGCHTLGYRSRKDWVAHEDATCMMARGNVVTLGGVQQEVDNDLSLATASQSEAAETVSWKYLNTWLKNILKLMVGFIPAFATFALKYDWWVLAYLGAPIWFGITGLRNIVQSILGGGGFRRSPLLRWNDYVSWQRLTDSLLFTGFSVPLLDYAVKTVLLDRGLGITTTTNPVALYSLMALANGIYLSSHNAFRGLPRAAIVGNFFRSVLSIPLAIGLNDLLASLLVLQGVLGVDLILQKWAAVISKAASDTVAGVIEGAADRYQNIARRKRDYDTVAKQLFGIYAQLELLFPEASILERLEAPDSFSLAPGSEARDMAILIAITNLDLLYFWLYQPRARSALKHLLIQLDKEDREIFLRSQSILLRHREISQLFLDGILGPDFRRALSFYLERSPAYLIAIENLARKVAPRP